VGTLVVVVGVLVAQDRLTGLRRRPARFAAPDLADGGVAAPWHLDRAP
jgi:hypothetical protein